MLYNIKNTFYFHKIVKIQAYLFLLFAFTHHILNKNIINSNPAPAANIYAFVVYSSIFNSGNL